MNQPQTPPEKNPQKLQLPVTDFAMRANLPAREPAWAEAWLQEDIYGQLRVKRQAEGAAKFILHCGPPYANGAFHMGHVLTYVLKDFIVRSKFMAGCDAPFVPGWDCHGLPIEWKVEQDFLRAKGKNKHDVTVQQLRAWCRDYAAKWVAVQKGEWQRFGVLADWQRPYLTMDRANEAGIVRVLGELVQRGLVYRGLRSTQWSWAEETAMAEAEVEYKDVTSTAVYVALELVGRENEFLVIWTTTPWTLPANRAVAVNVEEEYRAVLFNGNKWHVGGKYWIAKALEQSFVHVLGAEDCYQGDATLTGKEMLGWEYHHPLYDRPPGGWVPKVVRGDHVTTESGTGLVHIAPAHGPEDFEIGRAEAMPLECPVDGAGKYEPWVEDLLPENSNLRGKLAGKLIWKAQKDIIEDLEQRGLLLSKKDFQHSYPVSWRSKEKLIYRSTEQWFVTMDEQEIPESGKSLRETSLARIYGDRGLPGVQWVPTYGKNRIGSMVEKRPDWCISRQRTWGVPITILSWKLNETHTRNLSGVGPSKSIINDAGLVVDEKVWHHIAGLIEREGIDAWDTRVGAERLDEFFPEGWLVEHGLNATDFNAARDILDVWFDSGTTHQHVLRADAQEPGQRFYRDDGKRVADLYQEGSDQHRGWFQSSLLTSVALTGDAPYESVVTSGFVVDGEGRKFSKSLGNGVTPQELLPKYGMDVIRLWVAASDYSEDIRYSPQIMDSMAESYRKFRNTLRWLLGNLSGYEEKMAVPYEKLPELEQYLLHKLHGLVSEVKGYYESYQFHRGYRALYEFCGVELSNFYFDVRKDVLYCDAPDSAERRACQTVLAILFRTLTTWLAPLMPFTAEEAWKARFGEGESVQLERFAGMEGEWERDAKFVERWKMLMSIRDMVNQQLETQRQLGNIKTNAEAVIDLNAPVEGHVQKSNDEILIATVCQVSGIRHWSDEPRNGEAFATSVEKYAKGEKCPRCWRFYGKLETSGVCLRCDEALAAQA